MEGTRLLPDLSPEVASHTCMYQCRAMCCRGPLILRLTAQEAPAFQRHAAVLGITLRMSKAPDGGGWVRFTDHAGECCPMLDQATFACRIYQARPRRCLDFPEHATPGCAISGGG